MEQRTRLQRRSSETNPVSIFRSADAHNAVQSSEVARSPSAVPIAIHDFSRISIRSPEREAANQSEASAEIEPADSNIESVQVKLTVSQPDDPYEQEADRVAAEVMQMSTPEAVQNPSEAKLQRKPLANSISPLIQRDEAAPLPPVMQPSDPASSSPIDLGLRFGLSPEFEAMLQQHVDQQLDPSVVETALSQINFNVPSPLPGPISLPAPPALPPTPPESPLVPRGAGPESPRPGKPENIFKALAKTREFHAGIESLKKPAIERGKETWNRLGPAGKVSTVVSISSAALGFAITDLETFRQVYAPLNGTVISLPGLEWFGFEGNVAGTNIMAGLHVDVGKQLSKLGFGPASFKAIGSPPSPQPLQLPGTTVQRSSDQAKETGTQVGEGIESRLDQSRGGGSPLSSEVLAFMEPRFGADFTQVRVHTDSAAVQLSQELGAHAFAIGNDIYFGAGKSPANDNLTAHELTHVIQQNGANLQPSRPANEDQQQTEHLSNTVTATDTNSEPDAQIIDISQVPQSKNQVSLRPATEADRLFWSNIDSHPLFKKLINNYMDGKGEKLILTQQEMLDLKPEVDFRGSKTFTHAIDTLSEETSEQKIIRGSALAQAHLPLTLGFFTVDYEGVLTSIIYTIPYGTKQKAGWQFNGLARFRDTWDFDPKPFATSHRGFVGELQTRIGNVLLPGASFEIESQAIPVSEGMEDGLGGDAIATFKPDATSKPNPSQVTPAPAPGVSPPSPPPPTAIQPKLAATGF